MAEKKDIRVELLNYVRANHPDEIEKAYDYFWEEEYPEDFLSGTALDVGFINFEDWLLCDRRMKDGRGFIDLFIEAGEGLSKTDLKALSVMKDSVISLYEVKSLSPEVALHDLLLGEDFYLGKKSAGFRKGDVFATRLLKSGRKYVMAPCVYPFGKERKEGALADIGKQFDRFRKNENPEGTMREFLKRHSYIFNTIWVSNIRGAMDIF